MAVTYLGGMSLGAGIPLFNDTLLAFLAAVLAQLTDLAADVSALEGDVAALQGDAAGLAQELADPKGMLEAIMAQLLGGPAAALAAIQACIESILSGMTLAALQQALLAGPATMIAALQSAVAEIEGKIASIEARLAGLAGRIAAILARIERIRQRVAALLALKLQIEGWRGILAAAGVHLFLVQGRVGALGGELDRELAAGIRGGSGPSDLGNGLLLLTTAGAAWTALGQTFRIT